MRQNVVHAFNKKLSHQSKTLAAIKLMKQQIKETKLGSALSVKSISDGSESSNESQVSEDVSDQSENEILQNAHLVKNIHKDIVVKHQLHLKRKNTLISNDFNSQFKDLMRDNPVVIFPELQLQAWDRLPRFTFLDADLKQMQQTNNNAFERKHQPVKSNFIGSPVRMPHEGGVLTESQKKQKSGDEDTPEVPRS